MKNGRKPKYDRASLMTAALVVAERDGYKLMSRAAIAERAGCSANLLSYYFGTMKQLQRAVMREAVHRNCLPVIAQGLSANDANARAASHKSKTDALGGLLQ